ncbi:MAG: phosphatidylserine decarboxylase family protein [Deltaproteobacteria bacterium]|jgi:phosphatidylserine decarboxylase|nr:phosphatidylserine decarboxylase family protein [Deltaproteobacteria bacterium]
MRKPSIGIAAEGYYSIFLSAFSSLIFAIMGCWPMAFLLLLLTIFAGHFFRDPERIVPVAPGLAVSPADGKVIRIENRPDPINGQERMCISIFMNVFSVHVNRMPVAGTIRAVAYRPGSFVNAALDKASRDNEQCCCNVQDEEGNYWQMAQIAGLVARRIVCRVDEGDTLARGERYGMIKFGSRVDLYIPDGYKPSVKIGESVTAGSSVLARKAGAEGM